MSEQFIRNFINIFFNATYLLLFLRVLFSWIPSVQNNFLGVFVYEVTEPILAPIRRLIPMGGLDFSPLLAFIILQIIQSVVERYI